MDSPKKSDYETVCGDMCYVMINKKTGVRQNVNFIDLQQMPTQELTKYRIVLSWTSTDETLLNRN